MRQVQANLDSPSDALSALLSLSRFIEAAPQRDAERAEAERQTKLAVQQAREEAALRGEFGEEERRHVYEKQKAEMERFYGGPKGPAHIMTSAKGTIAHAELDRIRGAAGLNK